ncbi:MAG: hypothetical protein KKF44_02700 [Nanoarchaeota archaeon]|nr:hypothetical protein [Nanoarchaeota archaeon]
MYKKLLEKIIINQESFVPLVFTRKQFNILIKYCDKSLLSKAEKKSFYTSGKKKLDALLLLKSDWKMDFIINGSEHMLTKRLKEGKEVLRKYSQKYSRVFISGSFLFSENFNDIDVFIVQKRGHKEKMVGKLHINCITEKDLKKPIYQSIAKISISNFIILHEIEINRPKLSELMSLYHESVIEFNDKSKHESARSLLFIYCLHCKKQLLDPKELKTEAAGLKLEDLDFFIKELCTTLFSKTYLYVDIHDYIKTLASSIKNIKPNNHLIQYKNTYEELIYGKRRSKAGTA